MVACVPVHEPELCDVAELDVFRYLLRGEVAVVVDYGQPFGMLVVEVGRCRVAEHEIVVDETHG